MGIIQADWKRIDIDIKWTAPEPINEVIAGDHDVNTYLYKIVGLHNGNYKLYYIGKCIKQNFSKRIFQKDHKLKQLTLKEGHKNHKIMVSMGQLSEDQKHKPAEVGDVESLLIHAHAHEEYPDLINKQCVLSHSVTKNYRIVNKGFRKEKMYKVVAYGLFMTK